MRDNSFIWKYQFRRDNITHIPYPFINHNGYTICITLVDYEEWFDVYDSNSFNYHIKCSYLYSSIDLRDCLDYCNIIYY